MATFEEAIADLKANTQLKYEGGFHTFFPQESVADLNQVTDEGLTLAGIAVKYEHGALVYDLLRLGLLPTEKDIELAEEILAEKTMLYKKALQMHSEFFASEGQSSQLMDLNVCLWESSINRARLNIFFMRRTVRDALSLAGIHNENELYWESVARCRRIECRLTNISSYEDGYREMKEFQPPTLRTKFVDAVLYRFGKFIHSMFEYKERQGIISSESDRKLIHDRLCQVRDVAIQRNYKNFSHDLDQDIPEMPVLAF